MVLPRGIVSIGSRAFGQCRSLSEIYLPDTVEYIAGDAFEDCICLESVNVATGNEHYINDQNVLFSADMTELVLCMSDDFVDDFAVPYTVRRIGEGAFCNWTELERLELSDETEEIGARAFSGCKKLVEIEMYDGLTKIGARAFNECVAIQEICLPGSIHSIGDEAFAYCLNLTDINLPGRIMKLSRGMFEGCTELKKLSIPENIAAIEERAFNCCYKLSDITIPRGVKRIGENAFRRCFRLKNVRFDGTREEWNEVSVAPGNECLLRTIKCSNDGED